MISTFFNYFKKQFGKIIIKMKYFEKTKNKLITILFIMIKVKKRKKSIM